MTILGGIFPTAPRWGYLWDSYPSQSWGSMWNDSWANQSAQSANSSGHSKVIEIPIHFVGSDKSTKHSGSCSCNHTDEWSDSDSDDDMNWNSSSGSRRKRRSDTGRHTPPKLRFSKATIHPEIIKVDDDLPGKSIKVDFSGSSLNTPDNKLSTTRLTRNSLRPMHSRHDLQQNRNKLDFIVCDSDIENDINETNSYSVYQYLKGFLSSTGRQIDCIKGDGNCFFRALSKVIYGSQSFYNDIRQAIVDVLEKHPKKFEAFTDGSMMEHTKKMREDKTWATQTEIYAAATLLNRDIYILSPDQTGDTYRWLLFKPQFKYNSSVTGCKCYITLCHTHGNHYDRIAACESSCNCALPPPEMGGVKGSVDLTNEDEIV